MKADVFSWGICGFIAAYHHMNANVDKTKDDQKKALVDEITKFLTGLSDGETKDLLEFTKEFVPKEQQTPYNDKTSLLSFLNSQKESFPSLVIVAMTNKMLTEYIVSKTWKYSVKDFTNKDVKTVLDDKTTSDNSPCIIGLGNVNGKKEDNYLRHWIYRDAGGKLFSWGAQVTSSFVLTAADGGFDKLSYMIVFN